jgi:hypothetical protein
MFSCVRLFVYFFDGGEKGMNGIMFYGFSQTIPVNIYKDNAISLEINIDELLNI